VHSSGERAAIIEALGVDVPEVLITGGGANAPFVRQLQADVYGKPVVPVDQPEGPALGAALLAAVGAGAFASVADAAKIVRRRPAVAPRPDVHRAYDEPYARFQRLYPALRAVR